MRYCSKLAASGLIVFLSACAVSNLQADEPARVTNPTAESRAELQQAISEALGVRQVTITDNALVNDSRLIIEPKYLTGRDFGRPEHFLLVLSGSRCVLVHQETQARTPLTETTCAAE